MVKKILDFLKVKELLLNEDGFVATALGLGSAVAAGLTAAAGGAAATLGSKAVGSLLGGGSKGADFQGQAANIQGSNALTQQANQQQQQTFQQQQELLAALQAQGGLQNQSDVYNQFGNIAAGQGPNPAQAMLNQATGANVANQAALMAGQRNSGANAGLIARQAAMQGGALQQQAAGQGAVMQANQSLNALGQQANIANTQAGQQIGATQFGSQAALANQQQQNDALNALNQNQVQMQSNINNANAGIAQQNVQAAAPITKGITGGVMSGLGAATATNATPASITKATTEGMKFAEGGQVPQSKSSIVNHLLNPMPMAHGGKVPALVSPGEVYLPPEKVAKVATAKDKAEAIKKEGYKIPGKAKVKGDSEKNDVVKKDLKPGGVVIPRTKAGDMEKAEAFVNAILQKNGLINKPKKK